MTTAEAITKVLRAAQRQNSCLVFLWDQYGCDWGEQHEEGAAKAVAEFDDAWAEFVAISKESLSKEKSSG